LVLTTQKVLKFTMKNNLVWKFFEIFWHKILHFKRVKMSETPCRMEKYENVWRSLWIFAKSMKILEKLRESVTKLRRHESLKKSFVLARIFAHLLSRPAGRGRGRVKLSLSTAWCCKKWEFWIKSWNKIFNSK
jgi:hypothetical protein